MIQAIINGTSAFLAEAKNVFAGMMGSSVGTKGVFVRAKRVFTRTEMASVRTKGVFVRTEVSAVGMMGVVIVLSFLVAILSAVSSANAQANEWTQQLPVGPQPAPRSWHAMAYDSARAVTVLYGGFAGGVGGLGDTWEWDGREWSQRTVPSPGGLFYHAMAYDSGRGVTVLFGGFSSNQMLSNATWEWDGRTWAVRDASGTGPTPRAHPALAYDSVRRVVVMFGGFGDSGNLGDTWEWNGIAWTQRAFGEPGPSPRSQHRMAFDAARGVTVLFGGVNTSQANDTWTWDGAVWRRLAVGTAVPSPRAGFAMCYDAVRGVVFVDGGYGSASSGSTWQWGGTNWSRNPVGGPAFGEAPAMVFDAARGVNVWFGSNGEWSQTWLLGAPCGLPVIARQPQAASTCQPIGVTFEVGVVSGTEVTFHWRKDGLPISPLANPTALTSTLAINGIPAETTGLYDCAITNVCGSTLSNTAALSNVLCLCQIADLAGGGSDGSESDGTVDGSDFIAFINSFATGDVSVDARADVAGAAAVGINPDGVIDGSDFIAFINAFAAGC